MTGVPFIASEVLDIRYRGQLYERLRIEPFVRKDGSASSIAIWRSTCVQCREGFDCTTPAIMPRFKAVRRCENCRANSGWNKRPMPLVGNQQPFAPREDAES